MRYALFALPLILLVALVSVFAFSIDRDSSLVRSVLIDVLSCRRGMSNSGMISRIAGDAIGADEFLPNMGSEDFLLCLSRQALEASCTEASVQPRQKVRETRAALVEHFAHEHFVHPSGRFAPPADELLEWIRAGAATDLIGAGSRNDEDEADEDGEEQAGQIEEGADQDDPQDAGVAPEEEYDQDFDQRAAA